MHLFPNRLGQFVAQNCAIKILIMVQLERADPELNTDSDRPPERACQ
jgi:hypothetical protein